MCVPDLRIEKWHDSDFTVGQNGTFHLAVRNLGDGPSNGTITVTDTLPVGLTYVSASGAGWTFTGSGRVFSATHAGPLDPAGELLFDLVVGVSEAAVPQVINWACVSGDDYDPYNNCDVDYVQVWLKKADLAIDKIHKNAPCVGDTAVYKLTVSNCGTASHVGTITVTDTLPAGLTFVRGSGTGWTFSVAGDVVTVTHPGPLAAGGSLSFFLYAAVGPRAYPEVVNVAHVFGAGDTNPCNDRDTDRLSICAEPDLSIDKRHVEDFVAGQNGTYAIVVRNVGLVSVTGTITVRDTLPTGLTFVSGAGAGWTIGAAGRVVTATHAGPLAAGDSLRFTLTVAVAADAPPEVCNSASVFNGCDTRHANDRDTDCTPIRRKEPDLTIDKRHTAGFVVGQNGTFTIVVTNLGPVGSTGTITVRDTLPAGLAFVSATGAGWTIGNAGAIVTATHPGPLAVGDSLGFTLTVGVSAAAIPSVTNAATVSGGNDGNPANNRDTDTVPVGSGAQPDLGINMVPGITPCFGDTAIYRITVYDANGIPTVGPFTVVDSLPAVLTPVSVTAGPDWSLLVNGNVVTATHAAALAPHGTSSPIVIVATLDQPAGTVISNRAIVSGGGQTNALNDIAVVNLAVCPDPDLTVELSTGNRVCFDSTITWRATAINIGPSKTSGTITVVDTLPAYLTLRGTTGAGWTFSVAGQIVTATTDAVLAPYSGSSWFEITTAIAPGAPDPFANSVTIGGGGQTNTVNDRATASRPICPKTPDLVVDLSADGASCFGDSAVYVVTVHDIGPAPTTGTITVRDTLPAGLTFLRGFGGAWTISVTGNVVVATTDAVLAPNGGSQFAFRVAVAPGTPSPVVNRVTVSGGGQTNTANDQASLTVPVCPRPDLTISLDTSLHEDCFGASVFYVASVHNVGPTATSGTITVRDTLPAGLTLLDATGTGWTITSAGQVVTATRDASLAAGATAPTIVLHVSIDAAAADPVVNSVWVSGGGQWNTANDRATLSRPQCPKTPDLTIDKRHTADFVVGQNGTFTIVVTNLGPVASTGTITVRDTLPAGLTLVSFAGGGWTPTITGAIVTATTPGPLAVGDSLRITLTVGVGVGAIPSVTNAATVSGGNDSNPANNRDTDTVPVHGLGDPDIGVELRAGLLTCFSDHATYQVTARNMAGLPTVGAITVVDTLPTGLTFVSATGGANWSFVVNGNVVTATYSAVLPVASSSSFTLIADIGPTAADPIVNTVTISGGGQTNTANDRATLSMPRCPGPDLMVGLTTGLLNCFDQSATWFVTARNVGPAATSGTITVVDTLPAGLTYASASGSGWSFSVNGQVVTATTNTVLGIASATTFQLTALIGPTAADPIVNTVIISGGGQTNTDNDRTSISVPKCPKTPDLGIELSTGDLTCFGDSANYQVFVRNLGGAPTVGDITVRDTLPAGLTFANAGGPGWTFASTGSIVVATYTGVLPVGGLTGFELVASIGATASDPIVNRVTVSGGGQTNTANDVATLSRPLCPKPDLTIDKRHTSEFFVGNQGQFDIVVTNLGPVVSTGTITVRDTLPAGLTYGNALGLGWFISHDGAIVTANHDGPLAVGDSLGFSIIVTVGPAAVPSVTNAATVSGGHDRNPANNRDSDTVPVRTPPIPDLGIDIAASEVGCFGTTGYYDVTVRNLGTGPTTGAVFVRDTLPAGVTYVSATGTGWTFTNTGPIVVATYTGVIPVGGIATYGLTVAVDATAADPVVNTVWVSGGGQTNTANDRVSTSKPKCPLPDLTIDKRHTQAFTVGQNGTFTLVVTNVGRAASTGTITVRDTLPAGLTFVSGAGTGWTIGNAGAIVTATHPGPLAIGDSLKYTLTVGVTAAAVPSVTNAATVSGGNDSNPDNNRDTDTVPVGTGGTPDLGIELSVGELSCFGQFGTYTVTVRNLGTAPTVGTITVRDTLPAGVTFEDASGTGWAFSSNGTIVEATNIAVLPVGGTATYQLTVRIARTAADPVVNTVWVSGGGQTNTANDRASLSRPKCPTPDLTIDKRHTQPFVVGGNGVFTMVVTNVGNQNSTGTITVRDTLPAGLTYVSAAGTGWSFARSGAIVTAQHPGPLAIGDSLRFTLTVAVDDQAVPRVINAATVSGGNDGNDANNRDTDTVPIGIGEPVDVAIDKGHFDVFRVGEDANYYILVTNVGAHPTYGPLVVRDTLPASLRLTLPYGDGWTFQTTGNIVEATWNGTLAPGAFARFGLSVAVLDGGVDGTIVNSATVRTPGDINPANDRDTDVATLGVPGELVIRKQAEPTEVETGDLVDYTVVVTNTGDEVYRDVVVEDELPVGVRYVPGTARLDGRVLADPDGATTRHLRFHIGTLVARQSATLTYRGTVRASAAAGELINTAVAIAPPDSTRVPPFPGRRSNRAQARVHVRESAFTDEGTIIGKVFLDCDCDSNGVQGPEELGIPGVRVVLEDGTSAISDAEGKYSIPHLRPRTHVLRVDTSTLPPGVRLVAVANRNALDGASRFVDLRKGELHRAEFVARDCSPEPLAAVKARRRGGESSGPAVEGPLTTLDAAAGPGGAGVPAGVATRVSTPLPSVFVNALLEGKLEWRHLRDGELCASCREDFEDRLRDVAFDGEDGRLHGAGRGAVYARGPLGQGTSFTLRYDTEADRDARRFRDIRPFEGYDVYGDASLHEFDARSTSRFFGRVEHGGSFAQFGDFVTPGDPLRLLGAYTRTLNGALAHLETREVRANAYGTQAREHQVVDELPGLGVSGPYSLSRSDGELGTEVVEIVTRDRNQPSRVLSRETRMRFTDYTLEPFTGRLMFRQPVPSVDRDLNPVSIRVTYEVASDAAGYGIYGGDVSLTPVHGLTLGAAATRDEDPMRSRGLASGQLRYEPLAGLAVTGEVAHSDSGGALFDGARKAEAWRGDARYERSGILGRVYAQRVDRGFDGSSSGVPAGREELGADARLTLGTTTLFGRGLRTEDLVSRGRRDGAEAGVGQRFGLFNAEAAYLWAQETDTPATATSAGTTPNDVSALRGRVGAELPSHRASAFAEYLRDLDDTDADGWSVGGDARLTTSTRAYLRHEDLPSFAGPFALDGRREEARTVLGLSSEGPGASRIFTEYRARDAFAGRDAQAAMGLRDRWDVARGVRLDGSLEHLETLRGGSGSATSVTGGVEYTRDPLWKGTARVEFRTESSQETWLGTLGLARKLSRDWTALARSTWFVTPDQKRVDERSQVGAAWRTTDRDRWDGLARYEHRFDQALDIEIPHRRTAHVVVGDLNFHPTREWTVSGSAGGKWRIDETDGVRVTTDAQMGSLRGLVDVSPRVDVGLIARGLASDHFRAMRGGLGAEVGVRVVRDLRVAAGWNVFGFRDEDLAGGECTDHGPYVRFGLKLGQRLLGRREEPSAPADAPVLVTPRSVIVEPVADTKPLTPLGQRTSDEVIAADLARIDAWQEKLASLPDTLDPWRLTAARAWLDAAETEYTDDDETGFAAAAFANGTALVEQLAAGAKPVTNETVPPAVVPEGSERLRPEQWDALERMKRDPGFWCARPELARMEVALAYAGNEAIDQGDCVTEPHLDAADREAREAAAKEADCQPKKVEAAVEEKPEPEPQYPDSVAEADRNVHFAFDQCDLSTESRAVVERMASILRRYPATRLRLTGHTDVRGTDAYNLGLSRCRLCAVMTALQDLGIDGVRIDSEGFGERQLLTPDRTRLAHARNRRVEMTLLDPNGHEIPTAAQEKDLQLEPHWDAQHGLPKVAAPVFPPYREGVCGR